MYIPEFWCGVITVILVELLITIILVAWASWDNKRGGES